MGHIAYLGVHNIQESVVYRPYFPKFLNYETTCTEDIAGTSHRNEKLQM
jgi:hypothetical protein